MEDSPRPLLDVIRLLRWPVAACAVAAMVLGLVWWSLSQLERRARALTVETGRQVQELADAFRTTTITETFAADIPRLAPEGLKLQVAVLEATERLERRDARRAVFDLVPMGTAVTEIRVPVVYRYQVDLGGAWSLAVRDGVCQVTAPAPEPALPPAIDTAGLEKRIEGSWLRFDEQEVMAELERSLTDRLSSRAGHPERLRLIRETARSRVELFVRQWLLAEDQWGAGRIVAVRVRFADEPGDGIPADFVLTIPDH